MQITVFGASGKVGSLVVEEALKRGYSVVAFVHSHNLFSPSGKLIVVKGDIYNSADVAKALRGSEAVISCLGSWGTPKKDVLTAAMRAIIPVMREHKIRRIITLTGSGAKAPGENQGVVHDVMLKVPLLGAGKVFADGEQHMQLLAESNLDWTTLRSPVMNNAGRAQYNLNLQTGSILETVNRRSVAQALLDQLEVNEYLKIAPLIHRAK